VVIPLPESPTNTNLKGFIDQSENKFKKWTKPV
jgi:hypothetical protein